MNEGIENVTVNIPAEKVEETKTDKFIRLGECRINKVIDSHWKDRETAVHEPKSNVNITIFFILNYFYR